LSRDAREHAYFDGVSRRDTEETLLLRGAKRNAGLGVYLRVFAYFKPFFWPTFWGLAITLLTTGLNLLTPWPFQIIIDELLPGATHYRSGVFTEKIEPVLGGPFSVQTSVLILAGALVLIHVASGLFNLWSNYLFIRVGLQALLRLRTDVYTTLHSLSLKFHDLRRSTDSSFRVAYDSQSLQTFYNRGFTNIFASVAMLVSTFIIMWQMDWKLTATSMTVIPFVFWALKHYASRIRAQSTTIQEMESAVLTTAQEGLSSIRVVQAYGREDETVGKFYAQARESLLANLRLTVTNIGSSLVVSTLMALGTALLFYVGTIHVLEGTLTLGALTVFITYLGMLYGPIQNLTGVAWALEAAAGGAARCFEILDADNDVEDQPAAKEIQLASGHLEFERVDFAYSSDRKVLEDITLTIKPGQSVAFVGGTGAGKSTLLSLVARFYDPTTGRISLDGRDLKSITKKSLRAQISIVLQDTLLFSTTVRENIAYGRPDATEEEIIEMARRAQAYDFIMAMPKGFDSHVGERGGYLSVGQRQRIGIARAFLKNAPLLLLDEPTSALDSVTEAAIMETLSDLMRGRTTLIVTHRLATVHHLDKIVVLDRGRIVDEGRGSELLTRNGTYTKFYYAGKFGGDEQSLL
jgi:ATP-binding cassette subfamily B protein